MRLSPLPAELTHCAAEPLAPDLPTLDGLTDQQREQVHELRDAMVLNYVLDLRDAWGDCHAKVEGARAWNAKAGG